MDDAKPTRFILIRHGQTEWNSTRRYHGQADIKLNENGLRQARAVGKRLAGEPIDHIYSSDLSRAHETAKEIAKHHDLLVNQNISFRESNFGKWQGLTFSEIKKEYPKIVSKWTVDPENTEVPGGETFGQLQERVVRAIKDLESKHRESTIVVVSHAGPIRAFICNVLGVALSNWWKLGQDNTAISVVSFYGGDGVLEVLNDTNHVNF